MMIKTLLVVLLSAGALGSGLELDTLVVEQDDALVSSLSLQQNKNRFTNPCFDLSRGEKPRYGFCDIDLDLNARANDLVKRLTLDEKIGWLGNNAKGAPSLKISEYQWWNEGLHGVANSPGVDFKRGVLRNATSFPQVITTSQSFNRTLFKAIGSAISTEARAFVNEGQAYLTFWTPNINIYRDPRWGRGHETPGEDVKLNSDYAVNFVQGFQHDPKKLKASACCKHFDAYSMEKWHGVERYVFNAEITERDMLETYLPAFEACVRDGKVSSLMCSYNAINGVPSCVNRELMEKTARKEWGFDGYITGDCGAVANTDIKYHYKNHSKSQIVTDTLIASVDVACDGFLQENGKKAIEDGETDIKLVDRALVNLFKVLLRLGYFDPAWAQPYLNVSAKDVNTPEHQQLALEAARQGLVLLKNEHGTLPLKPANMGDIALIGPHSESKSAMQGNYFGQAPYIISVKEGLSKLFPNTKSYQGCDLTDPKSKDGLLNNAVEAASKASQTILAVGIDTSVEAEERDRTEITFPGRQMELIRKVADAASKAGKPPVVVVVISGGSLDLTEAVRHKHVGAILWCGYPGQSGGQAIAETLFGHNNPSGRLTQTIYPGEFAKNVSMFDMNMYPDAKSGYPGRTYRFYNGPVVYPFGSGQSFTEFNMTYSYDKESQALDIGVTNVGQVPGVEVVLVFLQPKPDEKPNPLRRKLWHYLRTDMLQPGQTQHFSSFQLDHENDLALFTHSHSTERTPTEPSFWQIQLEGSSNNKQGHVTIPLL